MAAVKSTHTTPELTVRRLLHRLGFRYRLHRKNLPGKPDLVFPSKRKIIFIHGCFWHRHACIHGRATPASHRPYWKQKFLRNQTRDQRVRRQLRKLGWRVLIIWECQIKNPARLTARLQHFLHP